MLRTNVTDAGAWGEPIMADSLLYGYEPGAASSYMWIISL
jgi:hypothetical protein